MIDSQHIGKEVSSPASLVIVDIGDLSALFHALQDEGYEIIGPTLRDKAIVYDKIKGVDDLPVGWTDEQDGGTYRLKKREDAAVFGYAVGPDSWKRYLFKPAVVLLNAERRALGFEVTDAVPTSVKRAFIGLRACDLHAIGIQGQVFLRGAYQDPHYAAAREGLFFIAINCMVAGGTCFCASMETGPRTQGGADLILTELLGPNRHDFLVEVGTEAGRQLLQHVPHRKASPEDQAAADQGI